MTVVYLGQSLPRLTAVPRAIMDESWEACTGYALAYEGRLRNPVIQDRDGIERAFVEPHVTQSLLLAATYRVLGFSLASGRMASVLVGLAGVLGVFYLMRTWLSHHAAGLVALLFAIETQFFILSRTVRPEVYLLCASVWMLGLLARGTVRMSLRRCFAAGVVGGVGGYTHPNMTIFAVLGVLLILYQIGLRRQTLKALTCFALGGIVGVVPFFAYVVYAHVCYDVSFVEQLGDWYTHIHNDSVVQILLREKNRWMGYLKPFHRGPWVAIVGLSMVAGVIRRHPVQVWALALILGHALLMSVLIRAISPRYLVVLSPWFAALVVVWAVQLWNRAAGIERATLSRYALRGLAVGGIAISLTVHLVANAYVIHAYRNADYDAVCHRIAQNIPKGAKVYGNLLFWTGLHRYPYLSSVNMETLPEDLVVPTLRSQLKTFGTQYVIRESDVCWTLGGLGPRSQDLRHRAKNRTLRWNALQDGFVDDLLRRRGILLDRFSTFDFGTIEVYRLRW